MKKKKNTHTPQFRPTVLPVRQTDCNSNSIHETRTIETISDFVVGTRAIVQNSNAIDTLRAGTGVADSFLRFLRASRSNFLPGVRRDRCTKLIRKNQTTPVVRREQERFITRVFIPTTRPYYRQRRTDKLRLRSF